MSCDPLTTQRCIDSHVVADALLDSAGCDTLALLGNGVIGPGYGSGLLATNVLGIE